MKTSISTKGLAGADTPLLAVIVAQGGTAGAGGAPLKDASLERAFAAGDYKGKKDETLLVYGAGKAERVLLIGVGKGSDITRTSIRRAAAIAARRVRGLGMKTFSLAIAKEAGGSLGAAEVAQVAVEDVAYNDTATTE